MLPSTGGSDVPQQSSRALPRCWGGADAVKEAASRMAGQSPSRQAGDRVEGSKAFAGTAGPKEQGERASVSWEPAGLSTGSY